MHRPPIHSPLAARGSTWRRCALVAVHVRRSARRGSRGRAPTSAKPGSEVESASQTCTAAVGVEARAAVLLGQRDAEQAELAGAAEEREVEALARGRARRPAARPRAPRTRAACLASSACSGVGAKRSKLRQSLAAMPSPAAGEECTVDSASCVGEGRPARRLARRAPAEIERALAARARAAPRRRRLARGRGAAALALLRRVGAAARRRGGARARRAARRPRARGPAAARAGSRRRRRPRAATAPAVRTALEPLLARFAVALRACDGSRRAAGRAACARGRRAVAARDRPRRRRVPRDRHRDGRIADANPGGGRAARHDARRAARRLGRRLRARARRASAGGRELDALAEGGEPRRFAPALRRRQRPRHRRRGLRHALRHAPAHPRPGRRPPAVDRRRLRESSDSPPDRAQTRCLTLGRGGRRPGGARRRRRRRGGTSRGACRS